MTEPEFAAFVIAEAIVALIAAGLLFPELCRAPIRAIRQFRVALLFAHPIGFGRDTAPHPMRARPFPGLDDIKPILIDRSQVFENSPRPILETLGVSLAPKQLAPRHFETNAEFSWEDEPTQPGAAA